METTKVQILIKCPECKGEGVISDPMGFWKELREVESEHTKKTGNPWSNDEYNQYISDQGYSTKSLQTLPPEECQCDVCDGTGESSKWIPVSELKELMKTRYHPSMYNTTTVPATTLDGEGYPTEEFLDWIKSYDTINNDPFEFIEIILDNWWMSYGVKIQKKYRGERKVYMSTGGWSGNEEIISALKENQLFWVVHYFAHQTGGHYTLRFTEQTKPDSYIMNQRRIHGLSTNML